MATSPAAVSSAGVPLSASLTALWSSCGLSSLSSCAASAQRLWGSTSSEWQRRQPLLTSALLTTLGVVLVLALLPDVREELSTRLRWWRRRKAVERSTSPLPSSASPSPSSSVPSAFLFSSAPSSSSASSATPSTASESDAVRLGGAESESRGSPIPFASSGGYRGERGERGDRSGGAVDSGHSRHRSSQAAYEGGEREGTGGSRERDRERDRDRDRLPFDRYDREREREREGSRRRSRWDEEDEGAGWAPQPHYRGDRGEKGGERRRRDRDGRDGYGGYANGGDDGGLRYRSSLSPTPSHGPQASLSLPSASHRHHQSFSSVHSVHSPPLAPPSPSQSMAARETSVSSLPSASMLSSTASYSDLMTPTSGSGVGRSDESFLYTLARGCELVKYGKYGSPHVRWFQVQLVNGLAWLSWGEPRSRTGGSLNLSKSIKMNDILDVKAGKQTAVFRQRGNDKLATDSQRCFSILTQRRSLDLQAKDSEERDRWVTGLRQIAHDSHWGQQTQQPPLASSASTPSLAQSHFPSLHRSNPSASSSSASVSFPSSLPPLSDFPVAQQKLVVTALSQQQWSAQSTAPPPQGPFPPSVAASGGGAAVGVPLSHPVASPPSAVVSLHLPLHLLPHPSPLLHLPPTVTLRPHYHREGRTGERRRWAVNRKGETWVGRAT